MLERDPRSRKGQNGRVAVIGGSHAFHGAPIFAALAAEASGVDLVCPFVHKCHECVTRSASYNFIVHTFQKNSLTEADAERALVLLEDVDSCIIGPGMAETSENIAAICRIAFGAHCAVILDAAALQPEILRSTTKEQTIILTPHQGELARLVQKDLSQLPRKEITALTKLIAEEYGVTVILKGPDDFIVDPSGKQKVVKGGNAGLTKGGTGDALAGLITGLIAQKMEPFDACEQATKTVKQAGAELFKTKGYAYRAEDIIGEIPGLLHRSCV